MSRNPVSIEGGKFEEAFAVAFAPVVALSELIKNASDSCVEKQDVIQINIDAREKTVRIKDNGYGFSASDISDLRTIFSSRKMSEGNELTRIGEPYAGSKGLGILTAFNLCNVLEIKTFSQEDNKAYHLLWEKGSGEIVDEEISEKTTGTELILQGVNKDNILLITDRDELAKLYASSIIYYKKSDTLPTIEIYKDGENLKNIPREKLEFLYKNYKKKSGSKGFFVAKASFAYEKDHLTISYDENVKQLYNISDASINLTDPTSLKSFLKDNKIPLYKPSEIFERLASFTGIDLDAFSGELYIWAGKKADAIDYPCGAKIYVNNYGLYNYLNKNNDWLQLSEISQNRKNTNYKLKNAFGYVHFDSYNENNSSLKISNERNDFKVNRPQKKFMFLMQDLIINIFASIDIQVRNYREGTTFENKSLHKPLYENTEFSFKELIKTNLTFSEISAECADANVIIDDTTGVINVSSKGSCRITFVYEDQIIESDFIVEEKIPSFEFKKRISPIPWGTSSDLKNILIKSTLKHLTLDEIRVESEEAAIQKGRYLSPKNAPGKYKIYFHCEKYGIELREPADINIETVHADEANKIKGLFETIRKYQKINDIIHGIADNHVTNPTFSMIGIRPLIEVSLKAFIVEFYSSEEKKKFDEEKSFGPEGKMNNLFNKLAKNELAVNQDVLIKYKKEIASNRSDIIDHYQDLNPNRFLHGRQSNVNKKKVFNAMNTFSLPINFIIEAINAKVAQSD